MTSAGPLEDLNPEATPPTVVLRGWRSAAGAAELRARVVELAVDLVLQEHDGRDHGERDQRDEEDVLHHRRTTLVLAELRLEPGTSDEQVHDLLPLLSSEPHARGWCGAGFHRYVNRRSSDRTAMSPAGTPPTL